MEGQNMMSKGLKIFVAIATTVTIVTGSVTTYANSNNDFREVETSTPLDVTYTNEMIGNNYTMASKKYTTKLYNGDPIEVVIPNAYIGDKEKLTLENYDYKNEVVDLNIEDTATFVITAPKAGRYYLSFDYLTYTAIPRLERGILPSQVQ